MRNGYLKEKGFNEGLIDCLFINEFTTIKDRALNAFIKMGFRTHFRSFLSGYMSAVKKKGSN
jgi:hypothetical protein